MTNVKLTHPDDPKFVIARDEDDAEHYKRSGWVETTKAVNKSDED